MRDPKQEARRIPCAYTYQGQTPLGRGTVTAVLMHEDGEVTCKPGASIAEATQNAADHIKQHFPGRSL